ncbi:hypothetical protein [Sunxiuqinia indica]|uniref:hypothetical protein n=1 Tax=Sunxiuqinia indica TaxID=2692584 RepID=UPI0013575095|nr:hypothetical protein [Sunxiuqinia indica]
MKWGLGQRPNISNKNNGTSLLTHGSKQTNDDCKEEFGFREVTDPPVFIRLYFLFSMVTYGTPDEI